MTLAIKKI